MNYHAARTELRKVGTAHATGDTLRAMYAGLVVAMAGLDSRRDAPKVYRWLQQWETDRQISDKAKMLLVDRAKAREVVR